MVENYMDYSDDDCMGLFTEGQKVRMRSIFAQVVLVPHWLETNH